MVIHFEMKRSRNEVLRVVTREYNGHTFTEIRIYYKDKHGRWRPGKSGLTLPKKDMLSKLALTLARLASA